MAGNRTRKRILDLLQDGFGVEDIGIKIKMEVEDVRFLVRGMRASGELARVFPDARATVFPERAAV